MNKFFKKRLELLNEIGKVQISKNGNYYVVLNSHVFQAQIEYGSHSVTINQMYLIGQIRTYNTKKDTVIMLTKDNKLKFKNNTDKSFTTLCIKNIRTHFIKNKEVLKLFFYNKRCEWIINYPDHIHYFLDAHNLIKSFKSLKDLLFFLGYRSKLMDLSKINHLISGYNFRNKENLIKAELYEIIDTVKMISTSNELHYYYSNKTIHNIHEELVLLNNKVKLESLSNEPIFPNYKKKIDEKLKETGVNFKSLISNRTLAEEGIIQKHCIGSKSYLLANNLFYSIRYENEHYSLHCDNNSIIEFRGSQNKTTPQELYQIVEKVFK